MTSAAAVLQVGGGGPPPPSSLFDIYGANLLDDWRADAGVHLNGSNVDAWTSQNGLGTVLNWGGGNQPVTTLNGKAAIDLQMYGQLAKATPASYPTGTTGDTKIFVAKLNENAAYAQFLGFNNNWAGTMGAGPGDGYAYEPNSGDRRMSGINPTLTNADIVIMSVASGANPACIISVNGVEGYNGSIPTRSLTTTGNVYVGRNAGAAPGYTMWQEVAFVNRGSSSAEILAAYNVLKSYWNL